MSRVAVALGSNLGDRMGYLREAHRRISEDLLSHVQTSSVYETTPWGIADQPNFLNAVIVGETEWKPSAILHYLKSLEKEIGRIETLRNGPREIDLDLINFGHEIHSMKGLEVPHPRCHERDFVLAPLTDIWPEWVHPRFLKTASELLARLSIRNVLRVFPESLKSSSINDGGDQLCHPELKGLQKIFGRPGFPPEPSV